MVGHRVLRCRGLLPSGRELPTGEKEIGRHVERMYSLDDLRFAHELGVLLGPPFVQGNAASVLLNGDEIFPPMLQEIRDAKASITFETYSYRSGDIGRQFAAASKND